MVTCERAFSVGCRCMLEDGGHEVHECACGGSWRDDGTIVALPQRMADTGEPLPPEALFYAMLSDPVPFRVPRGGIRFMPPPEPDA